MTLSTTPLEQKLSLTPSQLAMIQAALRAWQAQAVAASHRTQPNTPQMADIVGILGTTITALGRIDQAAARLARRMKAASVERLRAQLAEAEAEAEAEAAEAAEGSQSAP